MTAQEDIIKTAEWAKSEIGAILQKLADLTEHSFTCDLLIDAKGECDYIIKSAKRGWRTDRVAIKDEEAACSKPL